MKRVLALIVCSGLAAVTGANTYRSPDDSDFSHRALDGIERVALRFQGFYPDFDRYGVNSEALRGSVTRRLDGAGIDVVALDEALIDPHAALLSVDLHANYSYLWGYAYSVSVKVHNKQPVASDPQAFVGRVVWNEGDIGVGHAHELREINTKVMTLVNRFITAFRSRHT